MLFYPTRGDVLTALLFFCIANIGFEMGGVFLNAYLPEIAPKNKIGRISGYGWSFGYVGGLIALAICFLLFINPENPINPITQNILNKDTGEHIRIINIFIAFWFAIFSIPTFLFLHESKKIKEFNISIFKESFLSLKSSFNDMKNYKHVMKFLIARLVYNDALITIFAFGGIYAKEMFNFTFNEIFLFGIILNISAGLGAFLFGFIDDYLGGKRTIQITNYGFIVASTLTIIAGSISPSSGKNLFWFSGVLIGIFSGPNQAASRALMGRLTPTKKENEFFGFFAFSGKATAFIGPLLFSLAVSLTSDLRFGIVTILCLFIIGTILLSKLDYK
jgi:UMF1 family MFS transporter